MTCDEVSWFAILGPSEMPEEHENNIPHTREREEYCKLLNR
jgi:hypothetical protein